MFGNIKADELSPERFVLLVGNVRSRTTIAGLIVDSHPRMLYANESSLSRSQWFGSDRASIMSDIVSN